MRIKLLSAVSMGTMLALAGCASPPMSATSVSVRFAQVPGPERLVDSGATSHLAAAVPGEHEGRDFVVESPASDAFDAVTVTLWGGSYDGEDVTFANTSLEPGNYTFGFWDHQRATALKGWIHVDFAQTDLVDVVQQWRDRIPEQKRWLAYDFEMRGKLHTADSAVFKSFAKQLRAFDKLDRELGLAIARETRMQKQRRQRRNEMLNESVVLMLPTGSGVYHPTTQPVVTPEDVARVHSGDAVTKLVLVADAQDTRQQLRLVNRISRGLVGCRAVLLEEADRLERRKRYYIFTDHIYNHDRKFVDNELRLQQTLNAIDQLNEEIADVRERRLALSFTHGLLSPDRFFDPLNTEQRDLEEERTVLSSQKLRFDLLFNKTAEDSPRRIVLQRQRQRVNRSIEDIDHYSEALSEARIALSSLKDATRVIHRQGDTRLLVASFVDPAIPSHVREAVEHAAVMTVRLESSRVELEHSHDAVATARTAAAYVEPGGP